MRWIVTMFLITAGFASPVFAEEVVLAKFMMGDRVRVSDGPLRQRLTPDTTSQIYGVQHVGAVGTVTNGPAAEKDGHVWWFVDFATGPDGWSAQTYLEEVAAPAGTTALIEQLQMQLNLLLAQIRVLQQGQTAAVFKSVSQ